jgi:hypothetical protein
MWGGKEVVSIVKATVGLACTWRARTFAGRAISLEGMFKRRWSARRDSYRARSDDVLGDEEGGEGHTVLERVL